jgi:hypothetical protein
VKEKEDAKEEAKRKSQEKKDTRERKQVWKERAIKVYDERLKDWKVGKVSFEKEKEQMKAQGLSIKSMKAPKKPTKIGVEREMKQMEQDEDDGDNDGEWIDICIDGEDNGDESQ